MLRQCELAAIWRAVGSGLPDAEELHECEIDSPENDRGQCETSCLSPSPLGNSHGS